MAVRVRVVTRIPQVKAQISAAMQVGLTQSMLKIVEDAKMFVPVDTGLLRSRIGFRVTEREAVVFANTNYAAFVEFGTSKRSAHPFMRPALERNKFEILNNLRSALGAIR